ncbi:unnamed protein product [Miscanthus lutarioriparius]|uniref:Uncharacterized protein n=1 Tax=Miscanthus lutarioriparius TaxID=422564 RepID=A0A811MWC1_9POAL|nr:unnamed protein product [Miscanthus lutarioriparius]
MATSCPTLPFDEARWIIRIRRIFDEEIEVSEDQPICVFDVPKPLLRTKPEAYIPQLVALGPWPIPPLPRRTLRHGDVQLSAAKRAQSHLPGMDFQQLVDVFTRLEHLVRAHYHRHLNLSNEALGWMMAIDVSFLLEFLQTFSKNNGNQQRALQRIPSRMSHLVDPSRRTSSHSMLLRDIVMLENQVPLFLLLKAIESRCLTAAAQPLAQSVLSSMLVGFFQEVSTFRGIGRPCTDANRHVHLLDILYSNMVPRCAEESHGTTGEEGGDESCHDHRKSTLNSVMDLLVSRGSKIVSVIADFVLRVLH